MGHSKELQEALKGPPPSWLTRGKKKMIDDALKAGYKVEYSEHQVVIWKGRHRSSPTTGIIVFPDGTAIRADTGDLSVCNSIRRLSDMRGILGL